MTSLNEDRNLLGRLLALGVIVAAVAGVHRLSCGAASCPVMSRSCCPLAAHAPAGAK